jgi:putative ABC transport system substrate-binding protein
MTIFGARGVAAMIVKLSLTVILSVLSAPQAAQAQPTGKVHRLGFLGSGSAAASANVVEAFRDGLRNLGWTVGQNIVIDYRFAENRFDRLPDLAAELVRLKVNLIVAVPAAAAVAAKNATGTIPIVMVAVTDPVGLGLIASFARPGGNVTGLSYSYDFDIHGKRLQLLKEAVPNAQRVAILLNPAGSTQANTVSSVKTAAQSLGVSLQFLEVRAPNDFDAAFTAMAKDRADALLVVADPLFGTHAVRLAELAAKNRLPSIYGVRGEFDPGGLIFYGQASIAQQVRQAAVYVDKLLKGAKPADLPVEQPTKFELVVNLKTAKALGLTIPPSFLLRADQIIE